MILELLHPVLLIVAKFTFIGVNIRRYSIPWNQIICMICIYLPEIDKFIGIRMFATVHHREFPCVQGNTLTITLGFSYQLLQINQYFLNTTLVLSSVLT